MTVMYYVVFFFADTDTQTHRQTLLKQYLLRHHDWPADNLSYRKWSSVRIMALS